MVHRHLAMYRLAYLYLVFIVVVYGLPEYLPVREAVATAPLDVVQNVGDALVYTLGRVAVVLRKERIFLRTLFQIYLYRSLEMVCSFHIAVVLDCLFQYLSPIGRLYLAEKEVDKVLPCVLVQFVVEFTEHGYVAVDVRFRHVLEDVAHLVVPALLHCRLVSFLCHVGKGLKGE